MIRGGGLHYYGEAFVKQFYPESVLRLQDKKEVPKIIYPYALIRQKYNADTIINELKIQGLYDANPMATHCKLYPLLEYYMYKHYKCSFYTLEMANVCRRKNKSLRDPTIEFESQLNDLINLILSSNSIDKHLQGEKDRFIEFLIRTQLFSKNQAIALVGNLMNMKEMESQLGLNLAKDLS